MTEDELNAMLDRAAEMVDAETRFIRSVRRVITLWENGDEAMPVSSVAYHVRDYLGRLDEDMTKTK